MTLIAAPLLLAGCTPQQAQDARTAAEVIASIADAVCTATDDPHACALKCLHHLEDPAQDVPAHPAP